MNVFLSWSGSVSHQVATALHQWLPFMHHSIKPFMSAVDISKGEKWGAGLSRELKDAQYGIVCVTPFNTFKPWMNFEAGALYRLPHLTPFLFRVDRQQLGHSPLTQFQLTEFSSDGERSKHEFFELLQSINHALDDSDQLDVEVLERNFDHWWTELKRELDAIPYASPSETRTAYKWLRTFEDLAVHDLDLEGKTVWFVTADVFKYALRGGIREKIESNLGKVRYRYLIPDPDGSEERHARDQLDRFAALHPERVEYRSFDRDLFMKQAASDYVVIESSKASDGGTKVFVRIPIADVEADFWFNTEERAAHSFYLRFLQLWESPVTPPKEATPPPAVLPPTGAAGAGS
jgi:hypothetical protein